METGDRQVTIGFNTKMAIHDSDDLPFQETSYMDLPLIIFYYNPIYNYIYIILSYDMP